MGKHRLFLDFVDKSEVRFFSCDGGLYSTANLDNKPIVSANRAIDIGDVWYRDENNWEECG